MSKTPKMSTGALAAVFATLVLGAAAGCGIYVVTDPLEAPTLISFTSTELKFHGQNNESYFKGYNLWYRYDEDDYFELCRYREQEQVKPTLGRAPGVDETITVQIGDLKPTTGDKSFQELFEEGTISGAYFAVSSYGKPDGYPVDSVLMRFSRWPSE